METWWPSCIVWSSISKDDHRERHSDPNISFRPGFGASMSMKNELGISHLQKSPPPELHYLLLKDITYTVIRVYSPRRQKNIYYIFKMPPPTRTPLGPAKRHDLYCHSHNDKVLQMIHLFPRRPRTIVIIPSNPSQNSITP